MRKSKIAIITYSRAYNYGSALQTYALNRYLTSLECDARTIDYTTDAQQNLYTIFEPIKGVLSIVRNLQSIIHFRGLQLHKARFERFLLDKVPMTHSVSSNSDLVDLNDNFDYFVCGSDQIWNAQCDDFDPTYMLSFVKDKRKCIAYAPSLGAGGRDIKTKEALCKYVKGFKAVSTRESESQELICKYISCPVSNVLDPVFLLDKDEWNSILPGVDSFCGDYILGYFIGDVEGMRDFAYLLYKKTSMPVVVIWKSVRDIKYGFKTFYSAGPLEFVNLVKNAKYVVTNSFHAISFSLIFRKTFWAFISPDGKDKRITSVLDIVFLKGRIVNIDNVDRDITSCIDYENVNFSRLETMISDSKDYLKRNLSQA